jgi:hypothetical protein
MIALKQDIISSIKHAGCDTGNKNNLVIKRPAIHLYRVAQPFKSTITKYAKKWNRVILSVNTVFEDLRSAGSW